MAENEMMLPVNESSAAEKVKYENVFRRGIIESPKGKATGSAQAYGLRPSSTNIRCHIFRIKLACTYVFQPDAVQR